MQPDGWGLCEECGPRNPGPQVLWVSPASGKLLCRTCFEEEEFGQPDPLGPGRRISFCPRCKIPVPTESIGAVPSGFTFICDRCGHEWKER